MKQRPNVFSTAINSPPGRSRPAVFIWKARTPGWARHGANFTVRFQISVPRHYYLDVETQGGDISVDAPLDGNVRLTTAAGDVRTSDVAGLVRIETASGSITLGNIGGDLSAGTAGGSIHVGNVKGDSTLETSGGEIETGMLSGSLKAETAGGDVVVGGATGQVLAQTAGGQIQIGPAGGSVRAETAGGSIRLQGARGRVVAETAGGSIDLLEVEGAVRASTAAGRILAKFGGNAKDFGPSRLETSMGDVYVYLPVNLPVTIDAAIDTAAGRRIQSDFPLNIQGDKEELVPKAYRGFMLLVSAGMLLATWLLLKKTWIGLIIQASLTHPGMVSALGRRRAAGVHHRVCRWIVPRRPGW